MSTSNLKFRNAAPTDIENLVTFINSAYRGKSSKAGWTTEADLLDGNRCDAQMLEEIVNDETQVLRLLFDHDTLVGLVNLRNKVSYTYLGLLTISPLLQNQGLARCTLQEAERFSKEEWQTHEIRMTVIHSRSELISYYERKGYKKTGHRVEFPKDIRFGVPKVDDLHMLELIKLI